MKVPGDFVANPLFLIAMTFLCYFAGVAIQQKTRQRTLNPTFLAIVMVGAFLRVAHVPYKTYLAAAEPIHFLLGPATVALAVPIVLSVRIVRDDLLPTAIALSAGAVTGAVSGYGLLRAFGGSRLLALSMLPKSLTTPIAMGVSQTIGGDPALTAVFAVIGGIFAVIILFPTLRLLRVTDPAAVGLAAGAAGSGIGAATVAPLGPIQAAFAGIAIGVNGVITAILAPLLVRLFGWR